MRLSTPSLSANVHCAASSEIVFLMRADKTVPPTNGFERCASFVEVYRQIPVIGFALVL
jgi:predicted cobalt transporter CbtA